MVIGGQAVLLYGEPRLTRDIDITLGIGPEKAGEIVTLAGELGLRILVEDALAFAKSTFVLPCKEEGSGIRVDFIFSQSSYEEEAIRRARTVGLKNGEARFASLEDVLIHKIIAGRPRDLEDARRILIKNTTFEMDYILRWLREFDRVLGSGYEETFRRLLEDARPA